MIEFTADDFSERAREMAKEQAKAIGVRFDRSKAPLWFLAVHSGGAQLRVCWFGPNGAAYSCAKELYEVAGPNDWLEHAKETL